MQVDGRGDLLADGPDRQVDAGHEHHGLEADERVARAVGVDRGQRAVVAGVHGLEHVEGLAAAALADDDAVGPHAQGVAHEVADGDLRPCPRCWAAASPAGRTCSCCSWSSAASSMVTMRSSSGMNDDSTLSRVVLPVPVPPETMMFSRPTDAAPRGTGPTPGSACRGRIRSSTWQRVAGELPDGEARPVDGQRGDDGVDARAVGQAGVDHAATPRRRAGRPGPRSCR